MSEDGSNLTSVIGALDGKVQAISKQIDQARDEVAQASRKIDELNTSQKQIGGQIGSLRQELSHLPEAAKLRSAEITKHIGALESTMATNTALLASQTQLFQQLLSARREEVARRQLEHEKAQFVLRLSSLLELITDGAVRYIFAANAIEACMARDVKPESFQGLTDQKTASDLIKGLTAAKLHATAVERAEAEHFLALDALVREIGACESTLLNQQGVDQQNRSALASRKQSEVDAVAQLSAPEDAAALRSRHITRTSTLVVGLLLLAAGAFSVASSGDWGGVPGLVAFCLGIACLIASWLSSDAHRSRKLAAHRVRLQSVVADAAKLESTAVDRDRNAELQASSFEARLGGAKVILPPATAATPMADRLKALLAAAMQAKSEWRAGHAEIALIGAS
jgi:hypothetical protein